MCVLTKPLYLLRLEGIAILALSAFAYRELHGSWIFFAVLFLAPDLFMLGYLANARLGAAIYNSIHTLFAPAVLIECRAMD